MKIYSNCAAFGLVVLVFFRVKYGRKSGNASTFPEFRGY